MIVAPPPVASDRISVLLATSDPLARAGIASQLRAGQGFDLIDEEDLTTDSVALVVTDAVDDDCTHSIRSLKLRGISRIVLLVTRLDDTSLMTAVEAGASGLVRRSQATSQNLVSAVRSAAAGEGSLPPDMLGRLLDQVGRLQRQVLNPRGLTLAGLTEREISVLRLLADGLDTAEVGRRLFFSERTVKNIIHDVTSRLDLRNRTHAVAYAIKQGLI